MHYRKALRDGLADALLGDAQFAGFTRRKAMAKSPDASSLPILTTATPRERLARDQVGGVERRVILALGLRRVGDDTIEDVLDLDTKVAEALAFEALNGLCDDLSLTETITEIDHSGAERIGTALMTFEALVLTPEGDAARPA